MRQNCSNMFFSLGIFVFLLSPPALLLGEPSKNRDDLVLYSEALQVPITRLAVNCFENIPKSARTRCRSTAVDRFKNTLYLDKRHCCSRWIEMACLKPYLFNAIYCNQLESDSVYRFFSNLLRQSLSENGDCAKYPPAKGRKAAQLLLDSPQCVPKGNL